MSSKYFEAKAKYVKIDENGKEKRVTEPYLVDAVSLTETESRMIKELEKIIHSDFYVISATKSNISEIFPNANGDRWFKAKVRFVSVDEESGKEKKINNYMLVESNSVKEASEFLTEELSNMIVPFEIPSVVESPIVDIFNYFEQEEEIPANLKPISETHD